MAERVFRKPALTLFAACGFALMTGGFIAVLVNKTQGIFGGAVIFAAFAYFFWLIGWQSAVRIRSSGIVVDNLLVRHCASWQEISEIQAGNGLEIRLRDGRRLGSLTFGGSIIGLVTGYRYTRAIAAKMRTARDELTPSETGSSSGLAPYSRRINFSIVPPVVILVIMEGIAAFSLLQK